MRLASLTLENYRNIAAASLVPGPELTVICGNNGQGKTNLLEAVWLLTGGKSFRGGKDAELIRRDAPFAALEAVTAADNGKENQIRLTVGVTEARALFDPKWTEEALCNLLDNAVKYTPAGGAVRVEVRPYEMFTAVCVRDTGPGIPEEEQAKIFGRFYRAPGAWQAEGVGIGLYLTRQIAEKQGGYIKLESEPGTGSCFALFLPRE